MIWIPNQLVGAPLGTTVKLQCHTESSPRAISYWSFNDMMVLNSDRFYTDERHHSEYKLDSTLVVKDLRKEDFGSYRCISKNSLGETDGTIMLYELETATEEEEEDEDEETLVEIVEEFDDEDDDEGADNKEAEKNQVQPGKEKGTNFRHLTWHHVYCFFATFAGSGWNSRWSGGNGGDPAEGEDGGRRHGGDRSKRKRKKHKRRKGDREEAEGTGNNPSYWNKGTSMHKQIKTLKC